MLDNVAAQELFALRAKVQKLESAIALHQKEAPLGDAGMSWCRQCSATWPCPTVTAAEEGAPHSKVWDDDGVPYCGVCGYATVSGRICKGPNKDRWNDPDLKAIRKASYARGAGR